MNKKIKQLFAALAMVCMFSLSILPGMSITAFAANGNIQFSDPSATVGSEVTVNLKVSTSGGEGLSKADIALAYDANALEFVSGNSVEGGSGALRAHGTPDANSPAIIVFSMKFKAKQAGSSQITVTSQEVYDANSQMVTMDHVGNSTVKVQAVSSASNNASLSSLQVSPGTLSPEFSADTDAYTVNVGLDVSRLTVNVTTADENASYVVSGNEELQEGENTVVCKVTAQDGTTVKDYTIQVIKSAEGASGETSGESAGAEFESISLEAAAKAISIIPLENGVEVPEGFSETTINIDGHKVTGWIWASESNPQYCVFYGINAAGEKNFYRYDLTEKTIQRYFSDPAIDTGVTQEEHTEVINQYNELLKDFKIQRIILIVLIAVVLVLFIVMVYLVVRGSGKNPPSGGSRNRDGRRQDFGEEEDNFDSFDEELDEPQVRRENYQRQPVVRRSPRPEMDETIVRPMNTRQPARPVRSQSGQDGAVRQEAPARREGAVRQESAARRENAPRQEEMARQESRPVRSIRPAGALASDPAHYSRPQRPAPEPVRPEMNLDDDDDFEFLDIDDE